jgi:hypothetical protein
VSRLFTRYPYLSLAVPADEIPRSRRCSPTPPPSSRSASAPRPDP